MQTNISKALIHYRLLDVKNATNLVDVESLLKQNRDLSPQIPRESVRGHAIDGNKPSAEKKKILGLQPNGDK